MLHYQFTDINPNTGLNLYRLKQIDYSGKIEYSIVRSLDFRANSDISIFPNPTQDAVNIKGTTAEQTILLYDVTGRFITKMNAYAGITVLDMSTLHDGVYQIHIVDRSGKTSIHKIVKSK